MTGRVLARARVSVGIEIRPCAEQDLPALEWMGLYAPHRAIIRKTFEAQQRDDALMLLAMAGGFPVGQVWIDFARRRPENTGFLWAVRVFHPLHGSGIGRHLMAATERVLRERGIRRAELGVERDNRIARRFYERLGWRVVGPLREHFRYVTPEGAVVETPLDEWLMAKELTAE